MVCRTTSAGSAFTSLARIGNEDTISDPACLSHFHSLRARYNQMVADNSVGYWESGERLMDAYRTSCSEALTRLDGLNISERRRESLRARIEDAQRNPPRLPNGEYDYATICAASRIEVRVGTRAYEGRAFQRQMARDLGQTQQEISERFTRLEREAPPRREALEGFSEEVLEEVRAHPTFREYRQMYAAARLVEEARVTRLARARALPQAIPAELDPVSPAEGKTGIDGVDVIAAGYNPHSERLEVVTSDGERRAYRHISPAAYSYGITQRGGIGRYWAEDVRGRTGHAYPNNYDAALGAVATRCTQCGQFATMGHECPPQPQNVTRFPTWGQRRTYEQATVTILGNSTHASLALPGIRRLQEAYREGPVMVGVSEHLSMVEEQGEGRTYSQVSPYVEGSILAERGDDGAAVIDVSRLRCRCDEYRRYYHCPHVDASGQVLRERLERSSGRRRASTPEERERLAAEAQARAEAAAASDWTRREESLQDAAAGWREGTEVSYSQDTAAFLTDYKKVLEGVGKEGSKVPVMPADTEGGVMGGMCRPGSGQAFGMEIEFDFPPGTSYDQMSLARQRIARELYEAGIVRNPRQERYHAGQYGGYKDYHVDSDGKGTWTYESDCSVAGGEIVTSGMYDTPETWQRLEKALEIVKRNGGIASKKAGCHVHVGTSSYGGDPAAYAELYRSVKQHEDVLYRVAANPERGLHRRGQYASPNMPMPDNANYSTVSSVRRLSGRHVALNLNNVSGETSDHPEFRVFDASLDLGTLQTQAKVAVGLTEAARRRAESDGGSSRGAEPVGSHKARTGRRRRLSDEELLADTATARSLADTLFTRREDKKQFFALFARNKWQAAFR